MKSIKLVGKYANGASTIVDDDVVLPKGNYYLSKKGYAFVSIHGVAYPLHRYLMQTPKGKQTDHLNRNRLDNRKENLVICDAGHNNQRITFSKTGHRGVNWYKQTNRWRTSIQYHKKAFHLGYFKELQDAVNAYNKKAKELYGEGARLIPAR